MEKNLAGTTASDRARFEKKKKKHLRLVSPKDNSSIGSESSGVALSLATFV